MNDATAPSVFTGLAPQRPPAVASGAPKTMHPTMPILIVGTMAVLNLTPSAAQPAAASSLAPEGANVRTAGAQVATVRAVRTTPTAAAPRTYHVAPGDTVSSIATRFGLSATSILALNGLSKTSLIYPGQVLKLVAGAKPAIASAPASRKYTVASGDTVAAIARHFGVSTAAVLAANGLRASSIIRPGQVLRIPGQPHQLNAVAVSSVKPTATAPKPAGRDYVVRRGDTVSSIASAFHISASALLGANGLSSTSTIYAGSTLRIPGAVTPTAVPHGVTPLNAEQSTNAATIISIGRELGVPDYGIVIALATAMQESSMRNLSYGHLDSVGLFQQRPSSGWGTTSQLTTPSHAARLFYGGPHNPNKGKTRGLLDVSGWESMTLTRAAQKVQVSAYPDAYAKWEASARFWFSQLG